MAQRRRVPSNNTTLFVEATPRGLVDVENVQEFLDSSPDDFLVTLNQANAAAALLDERFVAIRVPIPETLDSASSDAVVPEVAYKRALASWNHGRVDKIAGAREPVESTFIYLIIPDTINDRKLTDNRRLQPCPSGFLEATPQGFVGVENAHEFLEDVPVEFKEAYEQAEKENPGQFVESRLRLARELTIYEKLAMRVTVPNGKSEAEADDAAMDTALRASQVNSFTGRRINRKEDPVRASNVYVHKPAVTAPGASGTKKADKKAKKRAAAGGGIAGSHKSKH